MKLKTLISCLTLMIMGHAVAAEFNQPLPAGEGPWIIVAQYEDKANVLALKPEYDLWRLDGKNKTVELMIHHRSDYQNLINQGFKVKLHEKLMHQRTFLESKSALGIKTIDNFPCYRTVTETFAAMTTMATNYPNLVTLVDIGNTWHKNEPGGNAGHDMQVVKITNAAVVDPEKPILYAMGSIHAREYPPAELVTRFAEYLLSEYGNDADVTWLVDYHEIHLLLQGNPDGRVISEGENSPNQRKNYNADHCEGGGGFGDMQGVDMNRNFEFLWNMGSGSSGSDCSSIFRGDTAVSEPETEAINEYIKILFDDDRIDDLITAAPLDKPGVYLDIHNFAGLTLFPFGYSNSAAQAPNHAQLQTLARKMSFFTGYTPEQSNASLGGADGASEDNAYGTLGVAAYTIELGSDSGFYTSCSYFENTAWPDNLPSLIYAAKAARQPYIDASGPDVIDLPGTPIQVSTGQMATVSGTATDLQFNNSNGTEVTQNITAVEAYLGMPSWVAGAAPINMVATDGGFNSSSEGFTGAIDTSSLTAGQYTVWFEATDASGVTGVPSAVFIDVVDPANLATVNGVVRDNKTNAVIDQVSVSYDGLMAMTDQTGNYSIQTSETTSDLTFSKAGYFGQTFPSIVTTAGQVTTQDVLLVPVCETVVLQVDVEVFNDVTDFAWSLQTGAAPNDWRVEPGDDHTIGSGKSFVSTNVATVTDKSLVSPEIALIENAELVFWHKHQFESGGDNYDGGVIEISTNGGTIWSDLGSVITENGYNGILNGGFGQPLGAVDAFVGDLGTFTAVNVDLSAYANQTVQIRWRVGTDNSTAAGDWKVDDISITSADICTGLDDIIFMHGFEN